ncbi:hypothetical protein [Bacillus thuringiensis]|uniref:hypothetical protein n=1 Tax=Bacillus thuringiensis TaxID=1428 RepID=UPI000BFB3E42|nr:hypothetical protein [Bacillus thuringiensis]MED3586566.1 hypothetical protein [Bacillus thuringiensis]PGL47777.1 hypothetical protein CN914_20495 [Bacillus thuringiensis]
MALNRWLTDGEYEIAAANGISRKRLNYRVYKSERWELEEALTAPPGTVRHNYEGKHFKWIQLALGNGIRPNTYYSRVSRGWGHQKAATKPARKKKVTGNEK